MTKNTPEAMEEVVEVRLQELIRCARKCSVVTEVEILPDGIEITVKNVVPTSLLRAAVSLQDCYPDGGVYVVSRKGMLVLCVYYKNED
jgi:hypothetical protein